MLKYPKNVHLADPIGLAMKGIIFSDEGTNAMLGAIDAGMPPLAGVDPMLAYALGDRYTAENEATIQAGYLVWKRLRDLGFEQDGNAPLPEGSVAKTGTLARK